MALDPFTANQARINATFVGFVADRPERGTLSLLYSCLSSLMLCIWAALHLNIPAPTETHSSYIRRYIKWSLLAAFCPEILLWIAWRQFNSARSLTRVVLEAISNGGRRDPWTVTHSFYAGMGGFVIDTAFSDGPFIPSSRQLVVTPRGIQFLAECGYIPRITQQEIADKSKSDAAGKLLCCLQASWMVLQTLLRFYLGFPVTQLEIHTLAHIFCAVLLFALWWHKPRWIMEPTRLEGEDTRELCAIMYMLSPISCRKLTSRGIWRKFAVETEMSELVFVAQDQLQEQNSGARNSSTASQAQGIFLNRSAIETASGESHSQPPDSARFLDATVREVERRRWDLAATAISHNPRLVNHTRRRLNGKETVNSEFVADHACNWPAENLLRGGSDWSMGIILWLVSLSYGAIHLCGWTASFPSLAEIWLWRAATIYLVFSGILWSLLSGIKQMAPGLLWSWEDLLNGRSHWKTTYIIGPLLLLGGTLNFLARLFLLLDSFLSLRSVPNAAYLCPQWALAIPHV